MFGLGLYGNCNWFFWLKAGIAGIVGIRRDIFEQELLEKLICE